jgi:hypothetical protein
LRKPQPVAGKPIQIGRLDFGPVATDIREAHIIVEYQQYVRLIFHQRLAIHQ